METPSVIHPKSFNINDIYFQIISYSSLSDEKAAKIAIHFHRTHKFKKKDKGKLFKVVTTVDAESANLW